jgi:hypothetical protein
MQLYKWCWGIISSDTDKVLGAEWVNYWYRLAGTQTEDTILNKNKASMYRIYNHWFLN